MRNPIEFTVLTLHKTIVLLHHLSIYASQKAANATWVLKPHIYPLQSYNTVLLALDNPKSILGRIQIIKGGNVDRGQPVRQSAIKLWELLNDVELFKQMRNQNQDPDSLVPVGNKEEVGFVSDDVRKAMLEDKLQRERKQKEEIIQVKSNLKTPNGAIFGSGYVSKDGSMVVGAAHGIDEMLKLAEAKIKKHESRYTDDPNNNNNNRASGSGTSSREKDDKKLIEKLKEEFSLDHDMKKKKDNNDVVVDLLDFGHDPEPTPESTTILESEMNSPLNMINKPSAAALPYPYTKEEAYITSSSTDYNNHDSGDIDNIGSIGNVSMGSGSIFDTIGGNIGTTATSSGNDCDNDLLNLSAPPPPLTTSTIAMNDTFAGMENMTLKSSTVNHYSNSVNIASCASSSVNAISSLDMLHDVPPIGTSSSGQNGLLVSSSSSSNNNSGNAISSLDILPPMATDNSTSLLPSPPSNHNSTMNTFPEIPPPDSPPPLPPMSPPQDPEFNNQELGEQTKPNLEPFPPPRSPSPIPMGGIPNTNQPMPHFLTPPPSQSFHNNNNNMNSNNNTMTQQQEMMMMLMNQQQQMIQQGIGNNDNNQLMQQMMMMNQQMMQQMMSMQNDNNYYMNNQQQPQNHNNNNMNNNGGNMNNNGGSYPSAMNPFS